MGHQISGIVGDSSLLEKFSLSNKIHFPVAISPTLSFLALSDTHLDDLFPDQGEFDPQMTYLSTALEDTLTDLSEASTVAYIETEYFGGLGVQGAVVFEGGKYVYGPTTASTGPISHALRLLGVRKGPTAIDEFDLVGFGRYRNNDEWIAAAQNAALAHPHPQSPVTVYPSRIDWWIPVVLTIPPLLDLGIGIFLLSISKQLGLVVIAVGVVIGALITALVFPCRYTVTDTEVLIRCGLIRQRIPIRDIVGVSPSSNPLSAPALSLQRVRIDLAQGYRLVSPADREGFIREIESKTPKN
jgi:hypothetical protein